MLIAVGFLFLLSSFEWTIVPPAGIAAKGSPEVVAFAQVVASAQMAKPCYVDFTVAVPSGNGMAAHPYIPSLGLSGPPVMGRRWLRLLVFRI